MELRLEIGSNMRKVLEEAGGLNEKWDDVMGTLDTFMKDGGVSELEIELRESDGEGGRRVGSVVLRKQFAAPRVVNVVAKNLASEAVQVPAGVQEKMFPGPERPPLVTRPAVEPLGPDEQVVFTDAADKATEG